MKAKMAWIILLLTAVSLGGSSKNFFDKKQPHCFAGCQPAEAMTEPGTCTEAEEQAPGFSPVSLFIFQLR